MIDLSDEDLRLLKQMEAKRREEERAARVKVRLAPTALGNRKQARLAVKTRKALRKLRRERP